MTEQIFDVSFEELQKLYVGRVNPADAAGIIETSDGQQLLLRKFGEILLYGGMEGETFVLNEVRRIALVGKVFSESDKEPFGNFSLVGPLNTNSVEQEGVINNLIFQFHYRELSIIGIEKKRYAGEEGVYFPPVVHMIGNMKWQQISDITNLGVRLAIDLELFDDPEFNQGIELPNRANRISLEKTIEIDFHWAGAARSNDIITVQGELQPLMAVAALSPLPCFQPTQPCQADAPRMLIRELPLRFVNLATLDSGENIAALCGDQIGGVCDVWRQQAILNLNVNPIIDDRLEAIFDIYRDFDDSQWSDFLQSSGLPSTNQVDVYVVNDVLAGGVSLSGGGATYDASKASVAIFLVKSAMKNNRFLLAHELGHGLGLGHPDIVTTLNDGIVLIAGTGSSVMQAETPNIPVNTTTNCQIFGSPILNPLVLVAIPEVSDCLRVLV